MIGGDAVDHRQRGIGLADARRMEPRKEPGRTRSARQAIALGPPVQLFLAAARAPGEDQRRDRRGELRKSPVDLERRPRLDGVFLVQGIACSGEGIGTRRHLGQRPLDREAPGLDRHCVLSSEAHRIADHDRERRERQVEGECAPGREGEEPPRGDGERHNRPSRHRRQRGDAIAGFARRTGRHVCGHGDGRPRGERTRRFAHRRGAAAVPPPLASAGASDQPHAEALQHGADDLGVAVARDHGAHIGRAFGLQLRQQQELPVPHREDLRMLIE